MWLMTICEAISGIEAQPKTLPQKDGSTKSTE